MNLGRWWGAAGMATALLQAGAAHADLGRLTVDEAVKMALRDNTSIYQAARLVEQAEGALAASRTSLLPQISASGSYSHSYSGKQSSELLAGGSTPTSTSNSRRGSLTADLNALNFESWSAIRESSSLLHAQKAREAGTRQAVALAVKQQFYAFVRAKLIARVGEATARVDSSNLALTQGLFEVGTAPKTDVLKARTSKSQGDLALITARHTVDLERLRLASLLGLADDRGIDAAEDLPEELALPDSSSLLQGALANRPDVRQLEHQIAAAQAGVSGARASRYPSVGINGSVQKVSSSTHQDSLLGSIGGIYDQEKNYTSKPFGWSVGGQVNVPITGWLYAGGRIRQRQAQLDIIRRNLSQKQVDVALEVRQAWLAMQEARQRLTVAREQLEFAEQSFELTREKYRLGSSTILELTTAEVEQTRSRSDLIDARVGLQIARAQLDQALGSNP